MPLTTKRFIPNSINLNASLGVWAVRGIAPMIALWIYVVVSLVVEPGSLLRTLLLLVVVSIGWLLYLGGLNIVAWFDSGPYRTGEGLRWLEDQKQIRNRKLWLLRLLCWPTIPITGAIISLGAYYYALKAYGEPADGET